jgi:bilirubin oxidase
VLINGTKNPFVQLPAQVVRLRLLNGSNMRAFNFGLSNNAQFFQIASDGGLLTAPFSLSRLLLSPGERAEVLINLSGLQGQSIFLTNYGNEIPNGIYGAANPAAMGMGTIPNYASNGINGSATHLIRFDVVAQTTNAVNSIPASLVQLNPLNPANSNITRNLTFTPMMMGGGGGLNGPFVINGTPFDMMTINYTIPLNNIEIWSLTNNSPIAHPFHIHNVPFYILDINGNPPPPSLAGKKDVVLVRSQQTVRFITQFTDFADEVFPYMYHCHMLVHEDEGMMGQFLVTSPATQLSETSNNQKNIEVYPNPNKGYLYVSSKQKALMVLSIELSDVQGKVILETEASVSHSSPQKINLFQENQISPGIYFISIYQDNMPAYRKKIIITE